MSPTTANSFDSRATLRVGDASYEIYRLDALQSKFDIARLPFSLKVLLENLLRTEGNGDAIRGRRTSKRSRAGMPRPQPSSGDRVHARARVDAGLHRRPRRSSISRRCATRSSEMGGDPAKINPLVAGRARDRPTRCKSTRSAPRDSFALQRRAASSSATRSATRSYAGARARFGRLRGRAAGHGDRPPGQLGVPRAGRVREGSGLWGSGRRHVQFGPAPAAAAVPGHARRHRLAHDDGQRPRRARLGRRRDRGRGGDARPADVDADPAGASASSCAACCREGATATDLVLTVTADAARARRGRLVRRVSSGPGLARSAAGRPRDDRQHVPGVRLDLRDLPDRRGDAALPGVLRPSGGSGSGWSRPTPSEQGLWHDEQSEEHDLLGSRWSSTSAMSCRASPGPKRPQDRVALSDVA